METTATATVKITDRIKSYEDACQELGIVDSFDNLTKDEVAYRKLKTIARALNEGWAPQFTDDEYRYYPWFYFYTQKEIDNMSRKEQKERKLLLFGASAYDGSLGGLGFAASVFAFSSAGANLGARLAVKDRELACYFEQQFVDIWVDFILARDGDENKAQG